MDIRPATVADLTAVAAIYDEQVAVAVSTFDVEPRPREAWEERLASAVAGDHFLVAVEGPDVLGYAVSAAYRPRAAYARTREVSVYVAAPARGRGVGRALYDVLLPALRADGTHLAVAVIAAPNPASERLHAAYGFRLAGVLPEVGWKLGRWVDTALYTLVLSPSS